MWIEKQHNIENSVWIVWAIFKSRRLRSVLLCVLGQLDYKGTTLFIV